MFVELVEFNLYVICVQAYAEFKSIIMIMTVDVSQNRGYFKHCRVAAATQRSSSTRYTVLSIAAL